MVNLPPSLIHLLLLLMLERVRRMVVFMVGGGLGFGWLCVVCACLGKGLGDALVSDLISLATTARSTNKQRTSKASDGGRK